MIRIGTSLRRFTGAHVVADQATRKTAHSGKMQPDLQTWLNRRPAGPKPKRPLPRATKKRAKQLREYAKRRKLFLEAHPICQVWLKEHDFIETTEPNGNFCPLLKRRHDGFAFYVSAKSLIREMGAPAATEIHHMGKRRGKDLLDESKWLAVSRENHERIEQNKGWARANGYLLNF